AFKPTANFSKMCLNKDNLYISQVLHKTFIEVNEEGTEAAAVSAVLMADSVSKPFSMVCERPFFFVIRDNETGTIIFMGSMVEP
ncbi:MAG: serpin family protein, partial [Candidatus Eremiobacterota bacterium]